jgi:predicted nuclease of restriction endonuclease-like (RecB) superfamily
MNIQNQKKLFESIKNLLNQARNMAVCRVNTIMTQTYFLIGGLIVENEQKGNKRAEYGKETLKNLSEKLTNEFGKGFSVTNLKQMRGFFLSYSKSQTLSDESENRITYLENIKNNLLTTKLKKINLQNINFPLSWSHYVFLMNLSEKEKNFYENESIKNNWTIRELKRQYDSSLYERIILSRDKKNVLEENLKKYHEPKVPQDILKDPYVLEFLGLEESEKYSESDLEQAIIDKIEHFLLELGKGFAFIGRQKRFTFEEEHFFVDLVFYNRLLKCFVLIDLKIGKLKHQDLGQMQMYVNYYDRFVKTNEENKTIGIIICKNKNDSLVEITLPKNSNVFAPKYEIYLPSKEQLKAQIDSISLLKKN